MGPEEFEKHQTELIEDLVDRFSQAMKEKLLEKMREGWFGFDNVVNLPIVLAKMTVHLRKPFSKENCIDNANLFAMVWNLYDDWMELNDDKDPGTT